MIAYLLCVGCRLGLHFFSKKNEAKKTSWQRPTVQQTHALKILLISSLIWSIFEKEFRLRSNSAG
jgi:hypothetical protein